MVLRTLNYKILKLLGGTLFFATFAILFAVSISINNHAKKQVEHDLNVGQKVFNQLLKNREAQLLNSAEVLTADFGFKQAVATQDLDTIESVLKNHGRRISADLMALISLDGQLLATSVSQIQESDLPNSTQLVAMFESNQNIQILKISDKLFQCIFLTVNAPRPIAIAMIGFEIDESFVQSLTTITNLEITIQFSELNSSPFSVSSLTEEEFKVFENNFDDQSSVSMNFFTTELFADEKKLASQTFEISGDFEDKVRIILSRDLNEIYLSFHALQIRIAIISLASILLALFFGVIFSRSISRPLSKFASLAKKIAKGEYPDYVDSAVGSQEMDALALAFRSMQSDIQTRQKEIEYQASHDQSTGLRNRFAATELIDELISASNTFKLIGFKLVNLQEINNVFGHAIGDLCLKSIALKVNELSGIATKLDDTSILWIPSNQIDSNELFDIKQSLENTLLVEGTVIKAQIAIGEIHIVDFDQRVKDVLRHLSIALEHAILQPSLYQVFDIELEKAYSYRLNLLRELELSLNTRVGEFTMFYQPKANLRNGNIEKFEALIRWNSKNLGFVSPELFIPIAEKSGLIGRLTDWVISEVINDIAKWRSMGLYVQVAINVSTLDITDNNLLKNTLDKLERNQLAPKDITFEITESELMKDASEAIRHLNIIKNTGFALSIDDFGTGYSSFSYLKNLPVNEIKIDKSFIMKLDEQPEDQKIVKTIISLAQSLNLEVVAEGVETFGSLELLKQWGCHWAQGYYLSKPMPTEQVIAWLENWDTVNIGGLSET